MDASGEARTMRAIRRSILGLAMAWLALPAATIEASAMRGGTLRGGLAAQEATWPSVDAAYPLPGRWVSFLSGGETTWGSRQSPPFTLPVRLALLTLINGDPAVAAASPLVEYFVWRRNLNPERFDRYHPFLGPRLPQGFTPPTPSIPPPVVPGTIVPDPPLNPPTPSIPPTVPEPPAILVILAGIAGALALRRRAGPVTREG